MNLQFGTGKTGMVDNPEAQVPLAAPMKTTENQKRSRPTEDAHKRRLQRVVLLLTAQDKLQDEWRATQIKTMREVGDSMREARESESVSLRELASRLKISAAFLSDMERARRSYTEKWALRAIQALEQNAVVREKRGTGSLERPVSRMVAGFKVSVVKCWRCGFSPVQLRTLAESGRDEFCFVCPNEDCEDYWRSPRSAMWQPTKSTAAEKWNAANVPPKPSGQDK